MSLVEAMPQQLQAFIEGRLTERELFAWLGSIGRDIDAEDADTRELWVAASGLLSEVAGYPHDVHDVQADMAEILGPRGSVRIRQIPATGTLAD
jgi:hypothetical protein